MKRLLLSAAIMLSVLTAFADLNGDGYYRVQNAITKRYAYLMDDKGYFDVPTTSADVQALELYLDPDRAVSDPATVFYINQVNVPGSTMSYNIGGQGTSIYGFLSEYMKIIKGKVVDGRQSYYASASKSGMVKYLGDRRSDPKAEKGLASVDVSGDRRLWYMDMLDADSDACYFGVAPSLAVNGKYYYPMYAAFPFNAKSEGMKIYIVTEANPWADEPAVGLKEVTEVLPAGTPVIIECSSPMPTNNRLNIAPSGSTANVKGNMLGGVYFNNDDVIHRNQKAYNSKTMRILTVKDGQLVFDVSDIDYLPRNQSYLQLSSDVQYGVKTYKVVSENEYNDKYGAVESISMDVAVDVYSLEGRLVKAGITKNEIPSLGKGLYILRSGYSTEKVAVR